MRFTGCSVFAETAGRQPADDDKAKYIPLITGSAAEFYIEPMLPLVGDIDVMFYRNTWLAIPRGHLPLTQLPAEFHNYVYVVEMIDSHLPGYVYLPLRYWLTKYVNYGRYNYIEYDDKFYLSFEENKYLIFHGPATFTKHSATSFLSVDNVHCVRCLSWPPQAADWPTRHRNYGWPDSATLDRVVSIGCDLVCVAHRQCRQDEWMGKFQWRLSFSQAEIVLINSWMPVQQIVYHMLRVYVKTEQFTQSADNTKPAIMSNYHIKTLMLWAWELKPKSWWTDILNLVSICVELLNTLSVWLTDTRCPHYFINSCNLLDNTSNVESVASKFMSIDEEYLSTWLVKNYIEPCLPRLFGNVGTSVKLQQAVSEIVHWRLNTSLYDMWEVVHFAEYIISMSLFKYSIFTSRSSVVSTASFTVPAGVYWLNELAKIDTRFSVYFSAVALLHVARKISQNGLSEELIDLLSAILERDAIHLHSAVAQCKSEQNTSELVELLQMSAIEHLTTYRQLMVRDLYSVATIATTDSEALYAYKHGHYQRCLRLSTQNVHALFYAVCQPEVPTFPEFIQLMDDNIVSLTALTLLVNPKCRLDSFHYCVSQLTLSLYLMTQCQLKLHHSVTSLVRTLDYIKVDQARCPRERTLDHLTLKLIVRKVYLRPTMLR